MAGKTKGYMFTSKKSSSPGIMSTVCGAISLVSFVAANIICFQNRGIAGERLGGVGLTALLFAVAALVLAGKGIAQKEAFQLFPRLGMVLAVLSLLVWGFIIYVGVTGL